MDILNTFPKSLPEPASYFHGVDPAARIRVRNVVVFLRTSKSKLQQRHFTNRVHYRYVLILVLETSGRVSIDGEVFPLQPGCGLLVLPYQFHHYVDIGKDSLRWLFVTFELDEGADVLSDIGHGILHPDREDLLLWQRITSLWQSRNTTGSEAELLEVLEQLLVRLSGRERNRDTDPPPAGTRGSWIAQVESVLKDSVMQGFNLPEVARKVGLSERQLRTRFEAETGVSIRRYKANYQLHRAASLMRRPELTLARIAELSGFNSQAVFTRFVRRETGLTPSAWRSSIARPNAP